MLRIVRLIRRKTLHGSSRGATLVEVLIAIAVLGLITSSILPVLLMLNKAEFKWTEQTVSESLIRTQVEYLKGFPYIYRDGNVTEPWSPYRTVCGNETGMVCSESDYEIEVIAQPIRIDPSIIDPETGEIAHTPLLGLELGEDDGIQEIQISIYHVDRLVISAKNYKVDRP